MVPLCPNALLGLCPWELDTLKLNLDADLGIHPGDQTVNACLDVTDHQQRLCTLAAAPQLQYLYIQNQRSQVKGGGDREGKRDQVLCSTLQ